MDSDSLTILIADDHPLFRDALKQVIAQQYPEAALVEAASVADLHRQVDQQRTVDLLLLDLHLLLHECLGLDQGLEQRAVLRVIRFVWLLLGWHLGLAGRLGH